MHRWTQTPIWITKLNDALLNVSGNIWGNQGEVQVMLQVPKSISRGMEDDNGFGGCWAWLIPNVYKIIKCWDAHRVTCLLGPLLPFHCNGAQSPWHQRSLLNRHSSEIILKSPLWANSRPEGSADLKLKPQVNWEEVYAQKSVGQDSTSTTRKLGTSALICSFFFTL